MNNNNLLVKSPKISVITVCYNAASCIEQTIQSVVSQSYENVEYLVIDGGSTDGTLDIIDKYRDHIDYFVSEPDKGIYDAMNKGIRRATGEWIYFLNAGDELTHSKTLKEFISIPPPERGEKPGTQAITILRGNIIRVYNRFKVRSSGITAQSPTLMDLFNGTFHHQACLIHKSLFEIVGLYSTEYKLCSDWKFFFDSVVLYHANTLYADMDIAYFKMNGASSTGTIDCIKEREHYLKEILGHELYNILYELSLYRKSTIAKTFIKFRQAITNNISPKMFVRLLNAKRVLKGIFGLHVN